MHPAELIIICVSTILFVLNIREIKKRRFERKVEDQGICQYIKKIISDDTE